MTAPTIARPLLTVSADSTLLACVAEDRIALIDTATLTLVSNGDAPIEARSVAFVGATPQLAIGTIDALHAYDVPSLRAAAQTAMPGGSTIVTVAGERIALAVPGGLGVARCTGNAIDLVGLTSAGPVDVVIGLDHERLMLAMPGRTEIVAATSQRVLSRLAAPLPPPPRIAGVCGQRRYVWIARLGARAVVVLRLSDGRTFEHATAAPVAAGFGHPDSPWIVVEDATGALSRLHVQTMAAHPLEFQSTLASCVGGGADPSLYWLDDDLRFMRTSLSGDAVAPGTGLQLQVGGAKPRPTPLAPTVGVNVEEPGPAPAASPTAAATASTPVAMTLTIPVGPRPPSRATSARTWRPALADWARAILAEPTAPVGMPILDATPIDALATRLRLASPAYRALALLYGAWLLGGRRPSLDQVGRTIAWEEVGGDGALPRAQLLTIAGGRVALRPAVARFLDEAAPVRIEVDGDDAHGSVPRGRRRAHVSSLVAPLTSARELAGVFGAAAITDEARAGGRRGLLAALDEAWLRRLPLIAIPSGELDLDTLAAAPLRPDHTLVVIWPDRDAPPAIEDWATVDVKTGS